MEVLEIGKLEYYYENLVNVQDGKDKNYVFTKTSDLTAVEGLNRTLVEHLKGENVNLIEACKLSSTQNYTLFLVIKKRAHAMLCLQKTRNLPNSKIGFHRLTENELSTKDGWNDYDRIHITYESANNHNAYKLVREKNNINLAHYEEVYVCGVFMNIKEIVLDLLAYYACPAYYSIGDKDCLGFCKNYLAALQRILGVSYPQNQKQLLDRVQVMDTSVDSTIRPDKDSNKVTKNLLYHAIKQVKDNFIIICVLILLALFMKYF